MSRIREHFFGCSGDEVPPRDEKNLRRLEQIFSSAIFQAPLERDVRMLRENGARHVHRLLHRQTDIDGQCVCTK